MPGPEPVGGSGEGVDQRAVCAAIGASSGSVYHRFPRRDDLVAAAWLRAQDRFLEVYLGALAPPGHDAAVTGAVTVLTWCRDHPEDAALLVRHALADLLRGDVSPALAERAGQNQRAVASALRAVADATGHRLRDVVLAVVDLPYTVARRTLRDGATPGDEDVAAVGRAATLLLAATP